MSNGNYLFMFLVALFFFCKSTRATAFVLFLSCMIYAITYYFVEGTVWWFLAVATIDFLTGLVMLRLHHKVYTVVWVGYLCFLAVPLTAFGWILYEHGYSGAINDNLGLAIMIAQLIAMLTRLLLDAGLYRYCLNNRLFRALNSYVNKCYNKIQSRKTKEKARRCQEK